MIIVADAGPLIALARIHHFRLLRLLYQQLLVPPAVRAKVSVSGPGRAGAARVGDVPWIRVAEVRDTTAVQLLRERLAAGGRATAAE